MPTAKTECTELSVGFGLLDVLPSGLSEEQILNLFSGSLPIEKYQITYMNLKVNPIYIMNSLILEDV